jgi:hypothetical protein
MLRLVGTGAVALTAEPGFGQGGSLDTMKPSARLARILDKVSGADRRCAGLTDDQITGVIGRWQALEAWAAAGKLGAIVALLCKRGVPALGTREPDNLPVAWTEDLNEEIAMILAVSDRTADKLIDLAWRLQARLPLTWAALNGGVIDTYKAQIIADATVVLDDASAAEAEALVACKLMGRTPAAVGRLIDRAVIDADPDGARKRREEAEKTDARVAVWREPSGTAAIAGFGCPLGPALEAEQAIQDQAAAYRKSGIPGTMDQLRNRAMLDRLRGLDARGPEFVRRAGTASERGLAARINMIFPIYTMTGATDNPGQIPGWGAIDPALVRELAGRAAADKRTEWHLTLTDERGWAIGHGCAKPIPGTKAGKNDKPRQARAAGTNGSGSKGWEETTWTLALPDGRELDIKIHPIPVAEDCDHRYESAGHDPSPLLRHLAEIRDGTCTRPGCARPATRCDFEHTVPFENGGRTCLCNGNPKCRHDHRVKQAPGWVNIQNPPGFHSWTAPSGRTYTRGPIEYPA